jgi:hypothetical protein
MSLRPFERSVRSCRPPRSSAESRRNCTSPVLKPQCSMSRCHAKSIRPHRNGSCRPAFLRLLAGRRHRQCLPFFRNTPIALMPSIA